MITRRNAIFMGAGAAAAGERTHRKRFWSPEFRQRKYTSVTY